MGCKIYFVDNEQSLESQIFRHTIAVEALPRLEILVAEHNHRVAKLSKRHGIVIAPATMKVIRTFEHVRAMKDTGAETRYWLAEVEVAGQQARIGGWRILGSLTSTDVGYLLSPINKDVDLSSYKDRGGQCDHCRTARPRSVTYILCQGDTIKLVGSTCLKDFTGHLSPSSMAMYADSLVRFQDEIEELEDDGDSEGFSGGGYFRQHTAVALAEFLGFVARSIRTEGWVSRTRSESMGKRATADVAWVGLQQAQHQRWMKEQILLGATGEQMEAKLKMMMDTYSTDGAIDKSKLVGLTAGDAESTERACREAILADAAIEAAKLDKDLESCLPTPADVAKAVEDIDLALEAFASKENRDDYEEKLLSVLNQGFAFDKNIGLAASICAAADRIRRDHAKEEARKLEKDEFFGEMGKRETFMLRLVYTQPIDGAYGRSYLHIFLDAEGRKGKWFSSSECLAKGSYEIKATVKKHEIYEGRKITQLSRCKIVRELTGEAMACPF
jgi:hypothetical protein